MDRKWRTNRRALDTVLSYPAFRELVTPWKDNYKLATLTDLYSVYTVLHIESKEWEMGWCEEGQFYYFIARQRIGETAKQAPAPEGDEDMPEVRELKKIVLLQRISSKRLGYLSYFFLKLPCLFFFVLFAANSGE